MLKSICAVSLLAAAALTTLPTAALAGPRQGGSQRANAPAVARGNNARAVNNVHQSIYQIYLGSPSSPDWGYGYGGYGDWSNPQSQFSNQQATANAIATGNDATAISNINQSNHQNYQMYPDYWGGAGYWDGYGYGAAPQDQFSNQQANGTAVAEGDHSTAVNNINQSAYENYLTNPGYWGYGY